MLQARATMGAYTRNFGALVFFPSTDNPGFMQFLFHRDAGLISFKRWNRLESIAVDFAFRR